MTNALARAHRASDSTLGGQTFNVQSFVMSQPALIEASAGTGKTYSITNLVLRALLGVGTRDTCLVRPLEVDELLIVTFTNAATADLRQRIYERIRSARLALEEFITLALNQVVEQLKDPQHGGKLDPKSARIVAAKAQKRGATKAGTAKAGAAKAGTGAGAGAARAGSGAGADVVLLKKEELGGDYQEFSATERAEYAARLLELSEDDEQELFLANNYSEEELNGIFVGVDVDHLLDQRCVLQDDNTKFIIKELVARSTGNKEAPLRRAVEHLIRAERHINNAAICTIHSFCNSMLTQIYALEAGEAFNTELKLDLSDEIHEAYYSVWRRLFYQKNSSPLLLELLNRNSPLDMVGPIHLLNGVRLAGDERGFYGYQLNGIDELLDSCKFKLDKKQALEPQLSAYIGELGAALKQYEVELIKVGQALLDTLSYEQFQVYVQPQSGQLKTIGAGPNKISLRSGIPGFLMLIAQCYELMPQARSLGQGSGPWNQVVSLLHQVQDSVNGVMKGKNTVFDGRKKPKDAAEQACKLQLDNFINNLLAGLKKLAADYDGILNQSKHLVRLLTAIVMKQELERRCKEQHVMDPDDILRRLDYALNWRGAAGESLARAIRAKYPLAMIDEFQDTDPIQFSIFSSIYLNAEALEQKSYCYLIGDPKQSIYAFRGSDINSYLKARDKIVELTSGAGVYTLDTNYRSSPDVVAAANAIFGLTLNHDNVNPFNESRITFEAVKSGKAKGLLAKVRAQGQDLIVPTGHTDGANHMRWEEGSQEDFAAAQRAHVVVNRRDFYLQDVEELFYDPNPYAPDKLSSTVPLDHVVISHYPLTPKSKADDSKSEILAFAGPANSYVVRVEHQEEGGKGGLTQAYAQVTAQLIDRVLKQGRIVVDGMERPVRAGDIAVIVRKGDESDLIQNELRNLQIPSVYLSDRNSVLGSSEEPSAEAIELGYLMEAMCDCTNRKKVFRVLGSRLLCLDAAEYQEQCQNENFEREVKLLSSCAQTWQRYGFMPAFMQWAHDPRHNVSKRLLALKDGERWYTNYCHIGEIIQGVHTQKSGIQAQLNWFFELIYNNQNIFNEDVTKKRLESEQDQIRIITIHKSKGLEFPIVFMPFLWLPVFDGGSFGESNEDYLKAERYYDPVLKHVVLDVASEREFFVQEKLPVYHSSTDSFELGKFQSVPVTLRPNTIITMEERREAMRLLYVAVTRARYANFFLVGSYQAGRGKQPKYQDALVAIQGQARQGYAVDVDREVEDAIVNLETKESLKEGAERFIAAAQAHPECFTVLDGTVLLEQGAQLPPTQPHDAAAPERVPSDWERLYTQDSFNISQLEPGQALSPIAQSFVYKDAIDLSFNIFSYSSLVAGQYTQELQYAGSSENTMYGESEVVEGVPTEGEVSEPTEREDSVPQGTLAFQMAATPEVKLNQAQLNPQYSVSALMQAEWQDQKHFYDGVQNSPQPRGKRACYEFPCGTGPGSFMHEVLEHVDFDQVKEQGCIKYILDKTFPQIFNWAHNLRYARFMREHTYEDDKIPLALWFNDVLEAPIVAGRYHCFALADLRVHSYEREMEFLMSNHSFNTATLNRICAQVAEQLLPDKLKEKFRGSLELKAKDLVGYITGSIDLACSIDLNARLPLCERADLRNILPQDLRHNLTQSLAQLKAEVAQGLHPELEEDPELAELGFAAMSEALQAEEGMNEKFYVIDYKSNYLGAFDSCYQRDHLIEAVYEHRYDVQFLIYSLALYRFLKRRFAVPFDAPYEELRAFYDQHIGGVIYLFLRGMRANYLRDHISNGVFATRLDFDVIYELDQMFSLHNEEAQ